MKHLYRSLLLPLWFFSASAFAQPGPGDLQPDACNSCACGLTGLANPGTTLWATENAHNTTAGLGAYGNTWSQQLASTFNSRFHRLWLYSGDRYTISLCNNTYDTYMWVANNAATPVIYDCDDDGCGTPDGPSVITFTPPANGLYRIYVYDNACGTAFNNPSPFISVQITRNVPQSTPPNDEPCGATVLPMNASCSFTFSNTTNNTISNIGAGLAPNCTPFTAQLNGDVWFTTTVPASGLIGIATQEGSICAGGFNLYTATACNGTFTQLPGSCALVGNTAPGTEPALVYDAFAAGLAVGETVYIRYWERGGYPEDGTFGICAYEAQRPPNDEPCGAVNLPVNIGCTFSTFSTENATPLSSVTAPAVSCGGPATNDLWFSVTVTPSMVLNGFSVNTTGYTLADAAMAFYRVFSGDICGPGTLTQIACNNNQTGSNVFPRLNTLSAGISLVLGETIWIRVWPQTYWVGTFGICAIENQPPPNNFPCGALPLPVNYGCILETYSNENATSTPQPYPNGNFAAGTANPTCNAAGWTDDVWYTVVMPPNGTIQLDTYAGSMNIGGMALYSATGSCGGGNLNLTQLACAINGSQQGSANMPYITYTNVGLAGQTLYVRVWRRGASPNGNFGLCARRTDAPPTNCFYTLTLTDTGGDGWGGSYVRVCVGAACTNYTVNGASSTINIGTNIGQAFTVEYFPNGAGFQNQNSFQISQFGQSVYLSGNSPFAGVHYAVLVDCEPPPAPQSDCLGAFQLCDQSITVNQNPNNIGNLQDLNPGNRGCLSGNERQGLWYYFRAFCAGNVAFTIAPTAYADYDFAVWGPFAALTCPLTQPPLRCSWAAPPGGSTPTGLAINPALPTTEGAAGTGFVRHLTVAPGDLYILYVDNWSMNGVQFNLTWNAGNTVCTDCPEYNPSGSIVSCQICELPVELVHFDAREVWGQVEVGWTTLSEKDSDFFEVQRSADGSTFAPVGRVPAAGESLAPRNYHLTDDEPLTGRSFYRLRQADTGGGSKVFQAVPVWVGGSGEDLRIFPNPADEEVQLLYTVRDEGAVHWRLRDASGRLLREGSTPALPGSNRLSLPVRFLDPGGYSISLGNDNGPLGTARFMKQ